VRQGQTLRLTLLGAAVVASAYLIISRAMFMAAFDG
jgi:hypothetical protein